MAKVAPAPEQQSMDVAAELRPQPKIPGNGCCCICCGAGPAPIDVTQIAKTGGKFVQLDDGRIVEYYVYGSQAADARVFLQVNGSMGSALFFTKIPPLAKKLEAENIKGISLNVPGHGFSSNHPHRHVGDWAKVDVEAVLKAEGVPSDAPLMIEGHSFGTSLAFSMMHHFSSRLTHVHLHVPALPWEVSKELQLVDVSEGLGKGYTSKYPQRCFLIPGYCCSPCMFCCCSMCFGCCGAAQQAVSENDKYNEEIGYAMTKIQAEFSIEHARKASIHGFVYNAMLTSGYSNWGFHPLNDIPADHVSKMKIMVSYGRGDKSAPESHGEHLAKFYSEKCNASGVQNGDANASGGRCLVNVADGGHSAFHVPLAKGELWEKFFSM